MRGMTDSGGTLSFRRHSSLSIENIFYCSITLDNGSTLFIDKLLKIYRLCYIVNFIQYLFIHFIYD